MNSLIAIPSFISRRRAVALPALAVLLLLAGCRTQEAAGPRQAPEVPVSVARAEVKDVPVVVRSIGNVEAVESVQVRSQVTGELVGVHFREGQDVNKGDLLFTLDRRQLEAELRRAESNLVRNQAQARNARAQAERYAQLMKEGVVAQQQYEAIMTEAEAADANVAADQAAVENMKVQLQHTRIYAPLSGRTGNLVVHRGNIVRANDQPLVTINQISPIHVSFAIPEQQLPEVRRRMGQGTLQVTAAPSAGQAGNARGELAFVDNTVDPATGTIRLKGLFPNRDNSLWPGQFVDVTLTLVTERNAVVVPSQAVQTGQVGEYVFVVNEDMTAEMRPVVVRRTHGNESVLENGVQPGDIVVTDGHLRLTRGARVLFKDGRPQTALQHDDSAQKETQP